jgi:hypothetical protein
MANLSLEEVCPDMCCKPNSRTCCQVATSITLAQSRFSYIKLFGNLCICICYSGPLWRGYLDAHENAIKARPELASFVARS